MSAPSPCRSGEPLFVRGRWWIVETSDTWTDCELVRLRDRETGAETILLLPFDRPRRIAREGPPLVLRRRRWFHRLMEALAALPSIGTLRAPAASNLTVLPYQLAPALAVFRHGATRVLIADDVGMGKTIEAGLIVAELASQSADTRALVLVPAGLRDQWHHELAVRFKLEPQVCDAAWLARAAASHPPGVNPWALAGVFIASMDLVKRPEVLASLEMLPWDVVVVDEAHLVTAETARRAAIDALCRRARRVVLLTATPHPGDPEALGALCELGRLSAADPPVVGFRRSSALLSSRRPRRSRFHRVRLTSAGHRVHALVASYAHRLWRHAGAGGDPRLRLLSIVLRKRALSGPAALADSLRRRLAILNGAQDTSPVQPWLPLDGEEDREDEMPDQLLAIAGPGGRREHRSLEAIAAAADRAGREDRKERWLTRFLERVREPVLVFTEYRDTLSRLAGIAGRSGRRLLLLHGGLDRHERSALQAEFLKTDCVLLATDAAATGLNLHVRCRIVIHYELPWTLSRLIQRAGRVDRLGQTRRVHEIVLVQDDEAERVVLAPLASRAMRARAAGLGADAAESLSESQIAAMVLESSTDVPPGAVPPVPYRTLDLGAAPEREAAHALRLRAAPAPGPRSPPTCRPIVTLTRRAARHQVLEADLFCRLSVSNGEEREVHAEICVVRVRMRIGLRPGPSIPARVRHLAATLDAALATPGDPMAAVVNERAERLFARVQSACLASDREPSARDRRLASRWSSTAQVLIQAGLFDRREVTAAEQQRDHRAVFVDRHEELSARRARTGRLRVGTGLMAVVIRGAGTKGV